MPRLLLAVAAAALLVTMTGCGDPVVPPSPSLTPTATPVFASEEEALAAAVAAYGAYLAVFDGALSDYDTTRLPQVATGSALEEALDAVRGFQDKQQVQTGSSAVDSTSLAGFSNAGELGLYACLDLSGTDVVNSAGESVLPETRIDRYPIEVYLTQSDESAQLVVFSEDVWSGDNFCD